MNNNLVIKDNRIPFLDNIRSVMVILVLIFHSAASYSSAVHFWPFHEVSTNRVIDIYMLLGDVFLMSNLFFIAGYFATPSYNKRGVACFIKDKFKILGIPWIIITVCILPIIDYINYAFNLTVKMNFAQYWILSMKKILQFNFGLLDMSKYIEMPYQYYQRYVWFLSLLLLYFIVFAFYMWTNKHIVKKRDVSTSKNKSKVKVFLVVGVLSIILFGAMKLLAYQDILGSGWFSFGHLLEFQLGKFMIYSVYFVFGVYAYVNGWFIKDDGVGRIWGWAISCFSLFGINMLAFKMLKSIGEQPIIYKILHVIVYPLWVLSFLGLFLALGKKYWNKTTVFNRSISKNSYNMYLIHYIFPMTIPLILSKWTTGTILIKFAIVSVITVVLSYLISKFILKKYPKTSILLIIGVTIVTAGLSMIK